MCFCLLRRLGRLPLREVPSFASPPLDGFAFLGAARDGLWCAGGSRLARAPSAGTYLALRNCAVRTVTRRLPPWWGIGLLGRMAPWARSCVYFFLPDQTFRKLLTSAN